MSDNQPVLPSSIPYTDHSTALFAGEDWIELGRSAGNHAITGKILRAVAGAKRVLLIGGVHGNETEGVRFMEEFTREFVDGKSESPFGVDLYVIPVLNPDGFLGFQRGNANGVDLNRNMPTKDWSAEYSEQKYFPGSEPSSEPETRILVDVLEDFQPDYIISFHSWKPMVNTNGPAKEFGDLLGAKLNMVVADDIGYPTPGSFGTYAGFERQIPTITLEFERGVSLDTIYPMAREGVLESIQLLESST